MKPADFQAKIAIDDAEAARRQLTTGLLKIGLAVRHHAWTGGEERNLSPTQGQILVLLLQRQDRSTGVSELANELALSQPTVSVAVTTLVKKALVSRERSSDDARTFEIQLTPAGRQEATNAIGWTDFLTSSLAALTAEEQADFKRSLIKVIKRLQNSGDIPVSRMCVSCRFFQPNVHPSSTHPHHCGYVDAPFGDHHLRLDCGDFQQAPKDEIEQHWRSFKVESS